MTPTAPRPGALVIRVAALGDTVLLTAMLRALAAVYRSPCDVVVEPRWIDAVLGGVEGVGQRIGIASRRRPYWISLEQQRFVRWLRRRGPSPTFIVDRRAAKIRWLLARAGVGAEWCVDSTDHPWRDGEHHMEHLLRLARERPPAAADWNLAPFPDSPPGPQLVVGPEAVEDCRRWLARFGLVHEPLVLVQTESRRTNRGRWPAERWVGLVRHVLDALPRARVLLLGVRQEARATRGLAEECRDSRVMSVAGELPLERLFALCTLAHSMISLDTGPAHVAAVLGCPTLVVAGIVDPRWYRPIGPRVKVVTALPPEEWPAVSDHFGRVHNVADVALPPVVEAWDLLVRPGPAIDRPKLVG